MSKQRKHTDTHTHTHRHTLSLSTSVTPLTTEKSEYTMQHDKRRQEPKDRVDMEGDHPPRSSDRLTSGDLIAVFNITSVFVFSLLSYMNTGFS